MKTDTKQRTINFIEEKQRVRPHELVLYLDISHVAVHKLLKKLIDNGIISKTGKPPFVYYQLTTKKGPNLIIDKDLSNNVVDFVNNNYLYISPSGQSYHGIEGFAQWIIKTHQEKFINHLLLEYFQLASKINNEYKKSGLIRATFKLKTIFKNDLAIDDLFFLDFYSLPKFGKTRIGQLVLFAKQSQNLSLIKKLIDLSKKHLATLIRTKKIDAICFIPHTVPRKIQFLREYERLIDIGLPKISLLKVYKDRLFVPQKSLSSLEDRIINARDTIFIKDLLLQFKRILLIDDAVGSGASMNETAKKIKHQLNNRCKVYGFSLVGSFKAFDIIKEI